MTSFAHPDPSPVSGVGRSTLTTREENPDDVARRVCIQQEIGQRAAGISYVTTPPAADRARLIARAARCLARLEAIDREAAR